MTDQTPSMIPATGPAPAIARPHLEVLRHKTGLARARQAASPDRSQGQGFRAEAFATRALAAVFEARRQHGVRAARPGWPQMP
jgi:hypothetical protein